MTRKLVWKDLAALPRFQNRKTVLDNSLQFVFNPGIFSSSLLSIISPASGFYSVLEPLESNKYPYLMGQVFHINGHCSARLAFLAPSDNQDLQGFVRVVSHLASAAGERGAFQILAEVAENSPEEEILYQAGFRPYAEQQIWKLPPRISYGDCKKSWIPLNPEDRDLVLSFYQRILPGQVQRIESPPTTPDLQGMISWKDGCVVGYAATQFGPKGILIDVFLDPDLDFVDEYLRALFFHLPYRNTRDVFLRVRSYQQPLASALLRVDAEPGPRQKAVVKRLTVYYNAKQTFRMQGFENQPDITTPISHTKYKK